MTPSTDQFDGQAASDEQMNAMISSARSALSRPVDASPDLNGASPVPVARADYLPFGRLARRWTPLRHAPVARGTSVIEMVVVLMLLLTVSFGMAEFSYAFFVKNTLEAAAREGARAGIVSGAVTTDVEPAVANQLKAAGLQTSATAVDTSKFTLTLNPTNPATMTVGTTFQVTVTLKRWDGLSVGMRPMSTMLGSASPLSPARSIVASATMRKEG